MAWNEKNKCKTETNIQRNDKKKGNENNKNRKRTRKDGKELLHLVVERGLSSKFNRPLQLLQLHYFFF